MKQITRMIVLLGMMVCLAKTELVAAPAEELVEMNYQGASIQTVIEYYAMLTHRSLIQAPNIAGSVTFRSNTKLTIDEAKAALESVFAINNIAVIPMEIGRAHV